jgi:hypothetical protein
MWPLCSFHLLLSKHFRLRILTILSLFDLLLYFQNIIKCFFWNFQSLYNLSLFLLKFVSTIYQIASEIIHIHRNIEHKSILLKIEKIFFSYLFFQND